MKTITQIIRDAPRHWVGDGFPVRSLFTYQDGARFDPFLLLDYAGPHRFEPAQAHRGVGEHPHRGFETVTIVYQGELEHRDSSGARGAIAAGDVQWMTAAAGVVHEEFHSDRFSREGGTLEMVQLWVNLPARLKMSQPRYQALADADIPRLALPGDVGHVRVIAGELWGTQGAALTHTPINVWDVNFIRPGSAEFPLPAEHTAIAVIQSGQVRLDGTNLKAVELAEMDRAAGLAHLEADSSARVLLLTGQPLGEPIVGQGPFVMNTPQEIHAAIADYRAGRMGRLS